MAALSLSTPSEAELASTSHSSLLRLWRATTVNSLGLSSSLKPRRCSKGLTHSVLTTSVRWILLLYPFYGWEKWARGISYLVEVKQWVKPESDTQKISSRAISLNHTSYLPLTGSSLLNWAEIYRPMASSVLFPRLGANEGSLIFSHKIVLYIPPPPILPPKLPYMTWCCISSLTGHSLNANIWHTSTFKNLPEHISP